MELRATHLGAITVVLTLVNIACIIMPYWMEIRDNRDLGIFETLTNSNQLITTKCDESYSETECGFLKSLQVGSVISILFGFFSSVIYFLPPRTFTALPAFFAVSGTCGHFVFSLITTVLFRYFKVGFLDDDGINQESGDMTEKSGYSWVYWVWVATTVLSFFVMSAGYAHIHKARADGKSFV